MSDTCCIENRYLRIFVFIKICKINMGAVRKFRRNSHLFCCLRFNINTICKFIYIRAVCHNVRDLVYGFSLKTCIFCKGNLIHLQPHLVHMTHAIFSAVCCFQDHSLNPGVNCKIGITLCIAEIFCAGFFYINLIISPARRCFECCLRICHSCFYIKFCSTVCSICIQCFILPRLYRRSTSQGDPCCFCIYSAFRKFSRF